MGTDFFILMKQELVLIAIIFILLFIKVGSKDWKNENILNLVNVLLLFNFVIGFFWNEDGMNFKGIAIKA